ncbi:MAG: TetR family transcriptional regulator [Chloroflexi bacterium]|nr:TetR family transcriptional regulator [Chloroflexota bacterium]
MEPTRVPKVSTPAARAAAAEIGEPTIYRYFDSKRDLYIQAVSQCRENIVGSWSRIVETSEKPQEAIQRLGRWYYEEMMRRPEYLTLRFRTLTESTDPEAIGIVKEAYMQTKGMVEELYRRGRADGSLRDDVDPNTSAWLFMAIGAIIDVTHLLGLGDQFGARELEGIGRFLSEAAWAGEPGTH